MDFLGRSVGDKSPIGFGFKLPNCSGVMCEPEWARPETIIELASLAHEVGFDSVWLHDHILTPRELQHIDEPHFYEPITLMSALAAAVPRIQLGVATLILPFRDPVLLAKQIVTLERLFPGRILVGLGIGQFESEFEAFGGTPYNKRGKVANEYLDIIRSLLDDGSTSFEGEFRSVTGAVAYPKPTAAGQPEIWIGGDSTAGAQRARRYGQAWIVSQAVSLDTITAGLTPAPDSAERPVNGVLSGAVTNPELSGLAPAEEDDPHRIHSHRRRIEGDAAAVAESIRHYVDAGVVHFLLTFASDGLESLKRQMRWFAAEVRPQFSGE